MTSATSTTTTSTSTSSSFNQIRASEFLNKHGQLSNGVKAEWLLNISSSIKDLIEMSAEGIQSDDRLSDGDKLDLISSLAEIRLKSTESLLRCSNNKCDKNMRYSNEPLKPYLMINKEVVLPESASGYGEGSYVPEEELDEDMLPLYNDTEDPEQSSSDGLAGTLLSQLGPEVYLKALSIKDDPYDPYSGLLDSILSSSNYKKIEQMSEFMALQTTSNCTYRLEALQEYLTTNLISINESYDEIESLDLSALKMSALEKVDFLVKDFSEDMVNEGFQMIPDQTMDQTFSQIPSSSQRSGINIEGMD